MVILTRAWCNYFLLLSPQGVWCKYFFLLFSQGFGVSFFGYSQNNALVPFFFFFCYSHNKVLVSVFFLLFFFYLHPRNKTRESPGGFSSPLTTFWDLNQLPKTGNPNPNLALSCSNALLFIMSSITVLLLNWSV